MKPIAEFTAEILFITLRSIFHEVEEIYRSQYWLDWLFFSCKTGCIFFVNTEYWNNCASFFVLTLRDHSIHAHIRKEKNFSYLDFHFKKPRKEEQVKPKVNRIKWGVGEQKSMKSQTIKKINEKIGSFKRLTNWEAPSKTVQENKVDTNY